MSDQNDSYDPSSSEEYYLGKSTNYRSSKGSKSFQKNYPKNILIPILQYLGHKYPKQPAQKISSLKQEVQRANTASLKDFHDTFTSPIFQSIKTDQLLNSVFGQILYNSKLKKKLFDLKVAQYILTEKIPSNQKQFREKISLKAYEIAKSIKQVDSFFQESSSIIYVLKVLIKALGGKWQKSWSAPQKNEKKSGNKIARKPKMSKGAKTTPQKYERRNKKNEELKELRKEVVEKLKSRKPSSIKKSLKTQILQECRLKQEELIETYGFPAGSINLAFCCRTVAIKCLKQRASGQKINVKVLNDLIQQFKNATIRGDSSQNGWMTLHQFECNAQKPTKLGRNNRHEAEFGVRGTLSDKVDPEAKAQRLRSNTFEPFVLVPPSKKER